MSRSVQRRRGTTAEHTTFTGALAELTVDTTKDTVVVHDGAAVGGYPLLREDLSNLPAGTIDNADISASAEIAVSKLANGTARQLLQTDAAGTGVEFSSNIDVPGTLDVTGAATFDNNVIIQGDLTVNGTETIINTQTLDVEDKNIIIGKVVTPSDITADGGGITLKGTTDKTINWVDATNAWTLSEHVNIASAKEYRIDGTKVLDATSIGSAVVSSSLTSVGTIATGVWNGTAINKTYLDATLVSTGDTGTVTSTMILDGTILNADVNASAAIAGTKISPDFGSQTIATTGVFSHALGAAATPSITFTGDLNTGVYSPGADQVAVATNGVERVEFGTGEVVFNDGGANYDFRIEGDTNANLFFVDASAEAVGIGTSAPNCKFEVSGGTAITTLANSYTNCGILHNYSAATLLSIGNDGTSPVLQGVNATNNTARNILLNPLGGSVGIGTTPAAGSLLHVNSAASTDCKQQLSVTTGTQATYTAYVNTTVSTIGTENSTGGSLVTGSGPYATVISNGGAYPINFGTNNTLRATIDSSGRLLVGTSSDSGGALLQVNGDRIRIGTAKTPASASDTGTTGEIAWDANYIYVCTATNTWKRVAIATW